MTTGEAIKLLKDAGFKELNWKGSHRKFGRNTERITIVYHRSDKKTICPKSKKNVERLITKIK